MSAIARAARGFVEGVGDTVVRVAGHWSEGEESGAIRRHDYQTAVVSHAAAELHGKGTLNQIADFLNRLPRPIMAFGVIWLFALAAIDPVYFAEIMAGMQLVPDHLWYLLGAVVGFYFGARELHKHRQMKISAADVRQVVENVRAIRELRYDTPGIAFDDSPEAAEMILGNFSNAAVIEFEGLERS